MHEKVLYEKFHNINILLVKKKIQRRSSSLLGFITRSHFFPMFILYLVAWLHTLTCAQETLSNR